MYVTQTIVICASSNMKVTFETPYNRKDLSYVSRSSQEDDLVETNLPSKKIIPVTKKSTICTTPSILLKF